MNSLGVMLIRAFARHCPRCGSGGIFTGWWNLVEECPECALRFERESGYWVGAMIINTTATFLLFLTILGVGIAVTWPEVAWTALLVATVTSNLIFPVLFYPFSKTVWMALDLRVRPVPGGGV